MQRVGYESSSRSHFSGTDIWSTANPSNSTGSGWVGRYLSTLPAPLDPLVAWNTTYETDFRSVYAKVIDNWLGGDSVGVLGGNFRTSGIDFV